MRLQILILLLIPISIFCQNPTSQSQEEALDSIAHELHKLYSPAPKDDHLKIELATAAEWLKYQMHCWEGGSLYIEKIIDNETGIESIDSTFVPLEISAEGFFEWRLWLWRID